MATQRKRRRRRPARGLLGGLLDAVNGPTQPTRASERLTNIKADALVVGLLAATGTLLVGGLLLTKSAWQAGADKRKQLQASEAAGTLNSPAFWANQLRTAFNPSGIDWMRDLDFTDITGTKNVARGLKTQAEWTRVTQAYLALTGRQVVDDLRSELSARDVQEFYQIIAKKPKQ